MVSETEYELLEEIGRGSYGKVYRARHDSGEVHAIKVWYRFLLVLLLHSCCLAMSTGWKEMLAANAIDPLF